MTGFAPILEHATRRLGAAALEARLPAVSASAELRAVPDDRYLSLMSRRIFRAGLKHSLVDAKWPAFEDAFRGFELPAVCALTDEDIDALMRDGRLIRHFGKLRSVRDNAAAMMAIGREHGGFAAWLADWPEGEVVGLWAELGRRFSQMGGNSGPAFLRMAGKDTFLLTDFVVRALNHWGAFDGTPKTRKDRDVIQARFNDWAAETGRPRAHLSMILAASVE